MTGSFSAVKQTEVAEATDSILATYLLRAGKLDHAGLERALKAQARSRERLDFVLVQLGLVGERDVALALSAILGHPIVDLPEYPAIPLLPELLGGAFVAGNRVMPIDASDLGVTLAMTNPCDAGTAAAVALRVERPVQIRVAIPSEFDSAYERLYGGSADSVEPATQSTVGLDHADGDEDVERLLDLANEAPVIRIVNLMIEKAIESRASDIHLEPTPGHLRVRYRIDGLLYTQEPPAAGLRSAIVSRIKIMAKLNIAEHRLPQDGRILIIVKGKQIDLRVATTPTLHGEGVVLRILDRESVALDLPSLGFEGMGLAALQAMLDRPNGIVLVTGPTGSGKTTTLYAALRRINTADRKVLTVEDPIEYQLEGVNQIQVKPQIDLTFARALRSILRLDPDVIMIGEIRDKETAQIAVQAALTGHLVLATVHTNTAAATIARLLDMGVEDYLIASTVHGIVAQRLVRVLCPECKEPYEPLPELVAQIRLDRVSGANQPRLWRSRGCIGCSGSGYRGRTSVAEVLPITDDIRRLILAHAEATEIQRSAFGAGMRLMREDGMVKALAGVTSIEEVARVTVRDE